MSSSIYKLLCQYCDREYLYTKSSNPISIIPYVFQRTIIGRMKFPGFFKFPIDNISWHFADHVYLHRVVTPSLSPCQVMLSIGGVNFMGTKSEAYSFPLIVFYMQPVFNIIVAEATVQCCIHH